MTAAVSTLTAANSELSREVVNKVNELIGLDRSVLSSDEKANELVNKLRNKIDALRDNFKVSMPFELNDESEFGKVCAKIESLTSQYATLKSDHAKIKTLIDEYKRKKNNSGGGSSDGARAEDELRDLVTKSISVQRYLIYIRTLIKLEEFM